MTTSTPPRLQRSGEPEDFERIPLGGFAPGTYVIRMEGRSRAAAQDAALGRDVVMRIR